MALRLRKTDDCDRRGGRALDCINWLIVFTLLRHTADEEIALCLILFQLASLLQRPVRPETGPTICSSNRLASHI